jgi:DeoR family transcriptional regulator, suf operon transcriptional repressor
MMPNSTSTKDKILNLVKMKKRMTVIQLASEILITEMAIRRHIQVLEAEGYLVGVMRKNSSGRPSKEYELTEKGEGVFPKHYKQIGIDLLQEVNRIDPFIIDRAIHSRQERLIQRFKNRFEGKSFKGQIKEMTKIQSELGFMAEERDGATEEVAQIKQSNCPYIDIAKDFPEICRLERKFFEELLDTTDIEKISSLSKGDHCCHYVIRKKL